MGHGELWFGLILQSGKVDRTIGVKAGWWKHSDHYILLIAFKVPGARRLLEYLAKNEERKMVIVLGKPGWVEGC